MNTGNPDSPPPKRLVSTFADVSIHRGIGDLIRRCSTNREDIYRLSLKGYEPARAQKVLDLGCGWGAYTLAVKGLLPPGSSVTGIDWVEENRGLFCKNAEAAGVSAEFLCGPADEIRGFGDGFFDLVLCGYSLYFFSELIPEIPRIIRPDGLFLAITHSDRSMHEFLEDVRIPLRHDGYLSPERFGVEEVLDGFSAENGFQKLRPFFGEVGIETYRNTLRFAPGEVERCFEYLNFKRYIISDESEFQHHFDNAKFHGELLGVMRERAEREGAYTLNKDDAIFRCRAPGKGAATP